MDEIIGHILRRITIETEEIHQEYEYITNYRSEVELWLLNLDNICALYSKRMPIYEQNMWLLDLSIVSNFTNRDLSLHIVISLLKDTPKSWKPYIEKLHTPRIYKYGLEDFKINLETEFIEKSKIIYISNYDAKRLVDDADKILLNVTKAEYEYDYRLRNCSVRFNGQRMLYERKMTLIREAVLLRNFVKMYSTSRRLLSISKLIITVIETSNFCLDRGFVWYENPILLVFRDILCKWSEFPFREGSTDTSFIYNCSFAIPQLLYSLVQLWFQYMLLDISKNELLVLIEGYLEKSCDSFDNWLLNFKSVRLRCDKYLTNMVKNATGIKYGFYGPAGIIEHINPSEIFKDESDEYINFSREFCELCPKALLTDLHNKGILHNNDFVRNRVFDTLYEAKRIYEYITIAGQHGLFIKNPVTLTLSKSILPRGTMTYGGIIDKEVMLSNESNDDTFPLYYRFDNNDVFTSMMDESNKLAVKYRDSLNELDLEQEFIRALTNNSGGVRYIPTEAEKQLISESVLSAFGKKRLIYYILNSSYFDSYEKWKLNVMSQATSGERKQVDRRGRVIQMVSNLAQLGPFLIYLLADLYGDKEPELSSKKNSGTIRDMYLPLIATGCGDAVSESADVEAMDASTNDIHTTIVNQNAILAYQLTQHNKYFFCTKAQKHIITRDEKDKIIKQEVINLHPGVQMLLLTRRDGEVHNFVLEMREQSYKGSKIIIQTSSNVFPSGRYSTNAQHGIFNMLLTRVIRKFVTRHKKWRTKVKRNEVKFIVKISGDDIMITIFIHASDLEVGKIFSDYLIEMYAKAGFRLTSELSRFSCTFLQQRAYFGTVLPKPDRLSIVSSEHGESVKTNILDGFSELRDILDELCGRVAFPHNSTIILYAMANMLRRVRCTADDVSYKDSLIVFHDDVKFQRMYLKKRELNANKRVGLCYKMLISKTYIHIILPVMYLFSKYGFDLPPMTFGFNDVLGHRFGVYTPRGDIHEWAIRKAIRKKEYQVLNDDDMILEIRNRIGNSIETSNGDLQYLLRKNTAIVTEVDSLLDKYLRNIYDLDLARYLGLDWIKLYSQIDNLTFLKRYRINKWPTELKERLSNILSGKLNVSGIAKSRIADEYLSSKGYDPPGELAFHRSSSERINQAISTGNETEIEFALLRRRILYRMLEYKSGDWMLDMQIEWLYAFDIEETIEEVKFTTDASLDINGGLMLSSGRSFERDLVLSRIGGNFYESGMLFSGYYGAKPGPWKEYNHEALVKFAAKVYSVDQRDISYVWHYANINLRYQEELMKMIRAGSVELNLPWKSVIHVRKCFEIGTYATKARRLFNTIDIKDKRLTAILNYVMRDIVHGILDTGMNRLNIILGCGYLIRNNALRYRNDGYLRIFGGMLGEVSQVDKS